jgi:hypothetical protein
VYGGKKSDATAHEMGHGAGMAVIGAVAASAGILSPILTYWISRKAGKAQGAQLERDGSSLNRLRIPKSEGF